VTLTWPHGEGRAARLSGLTSAPSARIVKAVAEGKGFPPEKWHPHLLRHACGTHVHDHDAPLQAVASLFGTSPALNSADLHAGVSGKDDENLQRGASAREDCNQPSLAFPAM